MNYRNIKVTSYRSLTKILKKHGFVCTYTKGKHEKWSNGNKTVAISNHTKRFSMYTAESILKDAGLC